MLSNREQPVGTDTFFSAPSNIRHVPFTQEQVYCHFGETVTGEGLDERAIALLVFESGDVFKYDVAWLDPAHFGNEIEELVIAFVAGFLEPVRTGMTLAGGQR
jgi:hypothetical protein